MCCNCEICTESREIRDMISRKDVDLLCKKVKELHNRFLNSDEDYYHCIMNGEWPQSVEILERCLEKAKQKRDSKNGS